jgi:type IV secretory pathway VirB2 component (pilin)
MLLSSRIHEPPIILSLRKTDKSTTSFRSFAFLVAAPSAAQGRSDSPFDTGFTTIQTVLTGTVAKVASWSPS